MPGVVEAEVLPLDAPVVVAVLAELEDELVLPGPAAGRPGSVTSI
jgi:hypothetical protein